MVGSFFQPKIVLCDLETMFSLKGREFRNGLAEVVKHAVIRDESLFSYLEKNVSKILNQNVRSLEEIVFRNCQIKADVVEIDEKENGVRQILNFGHTLGHALESLYGFSKKLLHGEAVSLGMAAAAQMSCAVGFCEKSDVERLQKLLLRFKLPIKLKKSPELRLIKKYVLHDKKYKAFFLQLEKAGIIYDNPLKLSKFINNNFKEVEKWWNSKRVQKASDSFCYIFDYITGGSKRILIFIIYFSFCSGVCFFYSGYSSRCL